jgi:phospholipid/cholesterol/gamma-HCH transport system ATP-binding protein
VLFRSRLVKFAPKGAMAASDDPVIRQFLAGRSEGPIGMDETADSTALPPTAARNDVERCRALLAAGPIPDPLLPTVRTTDVLREAEWSPED